MAPRFLTAAMAILLTIATSGSAGATSMAPHPKLANLKGAWVGPGANGGYFRLELDEHGSGLLAINENVAAEKVAIYKVTATQLDGYSIIFVLRPAGKADPTVALSGETAGYDMSLVLSGVLEPESGVPLSDQVHWKNPVTLEPEEFLLENLDRVRKASVQFRADNKI